MTNVLSCLNIKPPILFSPIFSLHLCQLEQLKKQRKKNWSQTGFFSVLDQWKVCSNWEKLVENLGKQYWLFGSLMWQTRYYTYFQNLWQLTPARPPANCLLTAANCLLTACQCNCPLTFGTNLLEAPWQHLLMVLLSIIFNYLPWSWSTPLKIRETFWNATWDWFFLVVCILPRNQWIIIQFRFQQKVHKRHI